MAVHHTLYFDKVLILASIKFIEALDIMSKVIILIIYWAKKGFINVLLFYDNTSDGKIMV